MTFREWQMSEGESRDSRIAPIVRYCRSSDQFFRIWRDGEVGQDYEVIEAVLFEAFLLVCRRLSISTLQVERYL